jgi:tRNA (cytidine/uridine-2'-O-)-methyltransferase
MSAPSGQAARLHIALIEPQIGPNAGNVGRLCLGVGAHLHLVHPLGFRTDEKTVRRAGLDYWKHVQVTEHQDLATFLDWAEPLQCHLFSARGEKPYTKAPFATGDVLVFGREADGLPEELLERQSAWRIPMPGPTRSLNLSNAVAVVAYAALLRIHPDLFGRVGSCPNCTHW